jgi:hypothetical protein
VKLSRKLLVGGAFCIACQPGQDHETSRQQTIAFGSEDAPPAVAAVERQDGSAWDLCSGTLIAPDVVLTAAHCVTAQAGDIDCDSALLGVPVAPELLRVSFVGDLAGAADPSWKFFQVAGIELLAEAGTALCDQDAALLFLAENVDPELAVPLPVSPEPARPGDIIRAAGYGAAHPAGTGERVRRISEPLEVLCHGKGCLGTSLDGYGGAPLVAPIARSHEFIIEPGACQGDSGGPALRDGALVGVFSRGFLDCTAPLFGLQFAALAARLRAHAEDVGGPLPDWAVPEEMPSTAGAPAVPAPPGPSAEGGAGGVGGALEEPAPTPSAGCQLVQRAPPRDSALLLSALFSVVLLAARRHAGRFRRGLAPGALLLLVGCGREVRDTEGRTFDISCKKEACRLEMQAEVPTPEAAPWEPTHAGRLLLACPSGSADGRDCRPLVCDGARVCTRLGGEKFECLDEFCQDPTQALTAEDRLALCLAETGAWSDSAEQHSRMVLAMSCRPPCRVPAVCRQLK